MFAKKILISLTLVAAIPIALSRHVTLFGERVFPNDSIERFPSKNIEDLNISENELSPDVEVQPDIESDDIQKEHIDVPDLEVTGNEVDKLNDNSKLHDFDSYLNKVNVVNGYPEVIDVDSSINEVNIDTSDEEGVEVPVKLLSWNQNPTIDFERTDKQQQDIPVGIENKRPLIQILDDEDYDDADESYVPPGRRWM